jgi:small subunit ribosomal protein S4e|tara:strand:- start:984 stop:1613 length:630 start_codon:yes stop_codon:yes gene_type:complete
MHLKRNHLSRKLPLPKKGTKYIARANSNSREGLPVVVAVRDMLKLAKTSKEVQFMINNKLLKINGKNVKDVKESLVLFNLFEAGKSYELGILPTGRYSFEETKAKSRLCKVSGITNLKNKKIQLNLHDGTNLLISSKEKVKVGDSVGVDFEGKLGKIISLERGKKVTIISGKNVGLHGKIQEVEESKVKIKFDEIDKEVELDKSHIFVR